MVQAEEGCLGVRDWCLRSHDALVQELVDLGIGFRV